MNSVLILLSDARGIYIPRDAVDFLQDDQWQEFDKSVLEDLADPYNEYYWETWDHVLNNAQYVDDSGNNWHLWQDGDLFAYCDELMTDQEYCEFFGQDR